MSPTTDNGVASNMLVLALKMSKTMSDALDELRQEKQDAVDRLRKRVYDDLTEELDGKRLPKPEFDDMLRERWNQHGGAKLYAELKNSEKTATAALVLVGEIVNRLAGR